MSHVCTVVGKERRGEREWCVKKTLLFFCGSSTKYNNNSTCCNKYNNYDAMCVCIYKNITECYYIIIKYHSGKREIQKYFSSFIWVDSLSALSPIKDPPSKA